MYDDIPYLLKKVQYTEKTGNDKILRCFLFLTKLLRNCARCDYVLFYHKWI
jgi:hypothetical protein